MFKRIGSKIIAVVGLVLSASTLALIAFYTHSHEQSILAQNHRTMSKLTESVIEGLQTVMLAGYADIAHDYAERLKTVPEVVDFLVLRTDGKEAFLDNKTIRNVNKRLGEEEFVPREETRVHQVMSEDDPRLRGTRADREPKAFYETNETVEAATTSGHSEAAPCAYVAPTPGESEVQEAREGESVLVTPAAR